MRVVPLSATNRVIAAHFLLVALSTALALGFVWTRTSNQIDAQVRDRVEAELATLDEEYKVRGVAGLARAISARVQRPGTPETVWLLADTNGAMIAGNLGDWPPTVSPGEGWVVIELYRTDQEKPAPILAASVILPGGQRMLVGHDRSARAAFDTTLKQALLSALGLMLALTIASGWVLSRLVLRRIDDVARTAREIRAGDLGRRVPLRGSGDEFDRLAEELNHMLGRIESLVTDLRMVTDSIAHDLRSPLTRLRAGLDEALDAAGHDREEVETRIARAIEESERVLSMLTALLDIARAEAGVGREQFQPLDLAEVARDGVELYAPAAEEAGMELVADAPRAVRLDGHAAFLAQALSNLIENAMVHAPEGSTITVSARREAGRAVLAVADRGAGIPEEKRDRVVERFVRLDPSRSGAGAGLGLALVQAVARLHEGTLALRDNAPGLWAGLTLPLPAGEQPARAPARRVTDAPAGVVPPAADLSPSKSG